MLTWKHQVVNQRDESPLTGAVGTGQLSWLEMSKVFGRAITKQPSEKVLKTHVPQSQRTKNW